MPTFSLFAALLLSIFCGSVAHADSPPVAIGVILPLSGPGASFGETSRRAMELALEDLTVADRKRVKVIYEDDGLVATRSVGAARKLLDVDKVDALITFSSSSAMAVLGITEARKVPHLAIASDPAVAIGKKYSFTYWALPEEEVRILYDYLVAAGKKRVAVASMVHNGAFALRDVFVKRATKGKELEIVANEEVMGDVTDFRSVLSRIKRKGPVDAFIPIFFPGQLALIVKQAREAGIAAPLYGFETFDDKSEIKNAGGHFTGVVYATGADATRELLEKFERRYPGESTYSVSHSYDLINLLVSATKERKDADSVVNFLRSLSNYPTTSGHVTATGDNRFNLPVELKTITAEGQITSVSR